MDKIFSSTDEMLQVANYAVELSSFEQHILWQKWNDKVTWEDHRGGYLLTVGTINGNPVCVSCNMAKINGAYFFFYEPTSIVVDHDLIKSYLQGKMSKYHYYDANSFGRIINTMISKGIYNVRR